LVAGVRANITANSRPFSVSLGACPLSDALNRAEHYRDVAAEYRRLAITSSSTQMRDRYLRMAAHYGKLAEDEEPDKQTPMNGE
jgi:hypothetical protein